jgi:hypothetical protein
MGINVSGKPAISIFHLQDEYGAPGSSKHWNHLQVYTGHIPEDRNFKTAMRAAKLTR